MQKCLQTVNNALLGTLAMTECILHITSCIFLSLQGRTPYDYLHDLTASCTNLTETERISLEEMKQLLTPKTGTLFNVLLFVIKKKKWAERLNAQWV